MHRHINVGGPPRRGQTRGVCTRAIVWLTAVLIGRTTNADAQTLPPRELAASLSIDSLVARLPGRPIALTTLIDAALRDGFEAQLATVSRRRAEASALYEGRAIDPLLHVSSDVASTPLTNPTAFAASHGVTAGIEGALPWGTLLSAEYARAGTLGSGAATGPGEPSQLSFLVSQPILEGFNQRTTGLRAAQVERAAAAAQIARTRQEIVAEIELQYWALAESQAIEAVYARSVELAQDILRRNVELASRDLIASVDVLTVRSGVAFRESLRTQARQARREQSDALLFAAYGATAAQVVETDTLPAIALIDTTSRTVTTSLLDALRLALQNRSDLRAIRGIRDAAQMRYAQARNGLLPNLALNGGWTSASGTTSVPATGGGSASAWRLGVSLTAPMLNRGDRGQALLASAQVDIESIRVRSAEAQVVHDVRTAVRAVRMGDERLEHALLAASLAWEQLTAERRRLELGLGDSFRLLQTEENAVQAQLDAVRARYSLLRATVRYWSAIGSARGAS